MSEPTIDTGVLLDRLGEAAVLLDDGAAADSATMRAVYRDCVHEAMDRVRRLENKDGDPMSEQPTTARMTPEERAAIRERGDELINVVDELLATIDSLEAENARAGQQIQMQERHINQLLPCPDCRDKVRHEGCQRCARQKAEAALDQLEAEHAQMRTRVAQLEQERAAQDYCKHCSTDKGNCEWARKYHGAVACCPECTHGAAAGGSRP